MVSYCVCWDDYETTWNNQNDENNAYLGVAGDLPNESVVWELVNEINAFATSRA